MNCQSFEEILTELARDRSPDQTMEANLSESALVHLGECTACALRLQDGRALTHCLDEMAREMKSLTTPDRVEEELRNTFRLTISRPVSSPVRAMDRRRSEVRDQGSEIRGRWTVAVAAVLLIMLGVAGLRLLVVRKSKPGPGRLETVEAPTAPKDLLSIADVGTTNSPAIPQKQLSGNPENVVRRTNPYRRTTHSFNRNNSSGRQTTAGTTTAIANDSESEVATHFMPLGYAGPINLQDGGQLVRVEMSRSAMLSLGLPVNMDRYSERVKADVLLGADGLARAIRFVQ